MLVEIIIIGLDVIRSCRSQVSVVNSTMSALENEDYLPSMFSSNTLNAPNRHLLFTRHILCSLFTLTFVVILRQKSVVHACVSEHTIS